MFTTEDKAFLRAILDNPDDTTARLVYADWLDEHDDKRGTYLRVEMELHALPDPADERAGALHKQLAELKHKIDPDWLACFDRPRIEGCAQQFAFLCPKKWDQLHTTDDTGVRYCGTCGRNVHYCRNIREARRHADAGECVAVSLTVLRKPNDVVFESDDELMGDFAFPEDTS